MTTPPVATLPVATLQNYIGGRREDSAAGAFGDLVDPASGELVARRPVGCAEDVDRAVAAATAAQPGWAAVSSDERIGRLERVADTVATHAGELAELQCREMGKPVGLGRTFIENGVAMLRGALADARSYPFDTVTAHDDGSSSRVLRHPLGVTAVITPWNFPVLTVLIAIGPLLAAGNTVVLKPSERSPLSTGRLVELLDLPAGVLNLVHGDRRAGAPLSSHPDVGLVRFTGSVAAGREVGASTGRGLHRALLELGGKDPVVVDAGVDPVATAHAVAFGAFMNSGQICTSMERIYVHRDVAEEFVSALCAAAAGYTTGDGRDEQTVLGPLVDRRQRELVEQQVADAVARGATIRAGGTTPSGPGCFYPATVLTDVDDAMLVMTEETFGPVAPVQVVESWEDGLARASRSAFGLAATVYTHDPAHAAEAASIPAAVTWVNQWQGGGAGMVCEPARDSGMGATGGHATYDAATRPSTVYVAAS
ncbi:Acyl-CoA reductase [Pseudonocardia ammonioxydans]|uniref:Acyl-CoA reductase n=1 Tax=Pseudonocardia ammonioxydans TaxID=260086 RepID=A0A1I4YI06_PSUAM|nr:aldehyde dehydrogenase family protein [Pseudonocardia ammonioxydans]SFN37656.1 Acyl-CoA reductase [Pseudonocardia ammonioxydans]